jgi:hypothetical protein
MYYGLNEEFNPGGSAPTGAALVTIGGAAPSPLHLHLHIHM